ncbi:MAG: carboxypeptidase regulatory-like domain-containing protein [Pyrinomonadaceae bacterium]
MRTLTTLTLAAFSITLSFNAASAQTAQNAQATGVVAGRVTDGESRPFAGVALVLLPAEIGPHHRPVARATTDVGGYYRMTGVPAGRYRLHPLAPNLYAPGTPGAGLIGERTVNLSVGEEIENEDVKLEPGSVITGRVTDAEGRPIIGERVTIAWAMQQRGRVFAGFVLPLYNFETDDRGVYRVYGLPPGRFYVSVGQDQESGIVLTGAPGRHYARTYYPDATEAARAKAVELGSGGEASGVDISAGESPPGYQASGRVVDAATGKPMARVALSVGELRDGQNQVGYYSRDGTQSDENGDFILKNIPPGRFVVFAANDGQGTSYSEAVPFRVADGDVSGLVVPVYPGVTVSGALVPSNDAARLDFTKLGQMMLLVVNAPAEKKGVQPPTGVNVRVGADGSFRAGGLRPGKVQFMLQRWGAPQGLTIMGVERDGVSQPEGFEIKAGEQVSGVRINVVTGVTTLRGQVEVRREDQPAVLPEDLIVSVEARRVGATGPQWNNPRAGVDARGRFVFEGLVGGEYELTLSGWHAGPPGAPRASPPPPPVQQTIKIPDKGEAHINLVFELSRPPVGGERP